MSSQDTPRESELLAAAAHELKTPLTLIQGLSAMLESETRDLLTDRQQEQLQQLRQAGSRLNAIIESVLHVENLPYVHHLQPVQLHSELQTVLTEAEPFARNRSVALQWRPRRTLPPVLADPTSVYQVLNHAVTAVVKHAPIGSEVHLRTRRRGSMSIVRIDAPGEPVTPEEVRHINHTLGKQMQPVRNHSNSAGLSWYVVTSVLEFYGGVLKVSPRAEYTVITIKLPISSQLSLFSPTGEGEI